MIEVGQNYLAVFKTALFVVCRWKSLYTQEFVICKCFQVYQKLRIYQDSTNQLTNYINI